MAKAPSALLPGVFTTTSTVAPPVTTQVPVLWDPRPAMAAAALKLPPCTMSIDCSFQANRIPQHGNAYYLPIGTIVTVFSSRYLYVSDVPLSSCVNASSIVRSPVSDAREIVV